ncbi:Plastid lipid-associated protein/fibrillin conserved domain containing protein [Melia azedarach]|uniref:Plastid lipid-associated protein/fibrillin conserved domain containing protein n=1 Tax=Melia azedarach TaxID=155640 RepID=A0ACC1YWB3_MELAZ|nr:Plastid lipid-associated protein/fibrillin conserved domain containing protein [Melia azedarach]
MALAFASSLHVVTGMRTLCKTNSISSNLNATSKLSGRRKFSSSANVTFDRTKISEFDLENKKHDLLSTVQSTQRGLVTTADQRSIIEEALVSLEGYNMGEPVDLLLQGFHSFRLGRSSRNLNAVKESDGGVIRNVVRWSVPTLLEEQDGATLVVSAKFDVVSVRNVYLKFEEITVQNINISEELQALIAPAILPRSFLSLQILQFIRSFKAQVPVTNPNPGSGRSVGGLYYLSYLDNNMLLGRAVGGGGVFVFTKAQPLEL